MTDADRERREQAYAERDEERYQDWLQFAQTHGGEYHDPIAMESFKHGWYAGHHDGHEAGAREARERIVARLEEHLARLKSAPFDRELGAAFGALGFVIRELTHPPTSSSAAPEEER